MMRTLLLLVLSLCYVSPLSGQCIQIKVISWNLQSGQSNDQHLANQMAQKGVIDLWGLSEVRSQSALDTFHQRIEQATGEEYAAKLSDSGDSDRLAILYRKSVFEPRSGFFEIERIKVSKGLRPGFAIRLAGKTTGQEFMFMVNHLKCCFSKASEFEKRRKQVRGMNSIADQNSDVPIIAVGDLNTRVSVKTGKLIDPGIKALIEGDGSYEWIRPKVLAQTEDTKNNVIDYILVANRIEGWDAESVILSRSGNKPADPNKKLRDSFKDTDHRPVLGIFTMDCSNRIEELEEEVAGLKELLESKINELEILQSMEDNE